MDSDVIPYAPQECASAPVISNKAFTMAVFSPGRAAAQTQESI